MKRITTKRIAKYFGIAAAMLVFLLTLGGWLVSRWLQSTAGRATVERKISEALNMPAKIESLSFSAWTGLTLKKFSATGPEGTQFEAAGISARPKFFPLLRGDFHLVEVQIERPHIRLVQDAAGKWSLPHGTSPAPAIVAATAPTSPQPVTALAVVAPAKQHDISIGKIIIERGTAEFIDNARAPFATLSGLSLTLRDVTPHSFTGDFTGGSAAFGGKISCDRLSGHFQLAGLGSDPSALTGNGTLALKNGNCSQFEMLRQISDVLRLASLANFEIADATANFQIAGGKIAFSPVEITAPPAALTLTGPATFDGALKFAATLHFPADFVAKQSLVAAQFLPPDASNRRGIAFDITGTFAKPRQNLAEKLTGTKDRKQQRAIAAQAIISALMDRKKQQPQQPAPAQP